MTTQVDYSRDLCEKCEAVLAMPADGRSLPEHECGVLDELLGYDWREAFAYATGEWAVGTGRDTDKPETFERTDVVEVIASDEGENDGPSWICLGRLRNGRFFFLSAGCDYTGWDCQAGGRAYIAERVETLLQFVLTHDDKDRLKNDLVKHGLYILPADSGSTGDP